MKNLSEKRILTAAYLTVEAAMLSPILISSVFMILYMAAHLHNKTCLKASAAEQAISGHEQKDPSYFALRGTECIRTEEGNSRSVRYTAGTVYLSGDVWHEIDESAEYKIVKPVKQMRVTEAMEQVITGT
ncbi:MAG: hypothetical protein Q4G47_00055 [Lachnospiraceae bacterium]|nr:hypothetical protein [Lachnospiraceae bacterium]